MIIERDLTPYVVYSGDPVLRALEKITANKARVIFLVDSHGHLDGVLSDGDFRRWVSGAGSLDRRRPRDRGGQHLPRSLPIGSSPAEISHAFGSGIDHVALVDERHHLVAIAINRADELRIGRHTVGADSPTLLISEIGINHQGDVARQGAGRPVGRGRRGHREVPAARHGVALPPGRVRLGWRGPRSAVHPRPPREVQPRGRPALRGLRPLPRHRHRGHVHRVGPGQRRPARRLRRAVAQGRLGRHDQPRPAAPHGRERHARW